LQLTKPVQTVKGLTMKKQFFACKTYRTAYKRAPWACAVCRVCGGFWAFESADDYSKFKGQK